MKEQLQLHTQSILLAEDDQAVADLLRRFLINVGYRLDSVQSGRTALIRIRKKRFDLLITDLSLPDLDGLELIKFARSIQPETRILAISGFLTESFAPVAAKNGAHGTLQKPFHKGAFLATVDALLQTRSRARSPRRS